jgi:diaminopimelate epimerase
MKFTKLHGCGNDYIYVDLSKEKVPSAPALARAVSDRHRGVGSDGLILIETLKGKSRADGAEFRMRMYNADGSEAEMCGNGIRGLAKYVRDRGMTKKNRFVILTGAGPLEVETFPKNGLVRSVKVDMGVPSFMKKDLGISGAGEAEDAVLDVPGEKIRLAFCSMGNPHAVAIVRNVKNHPVTTLGPAVENHPIFKNRINVHFVQIISQKEARMRTWERGSGETQACGTGASAVAAVGIRKGWFKPRVLIHLAGGDLRIDWLGEGSKLYMTGPAEEVFTGEILL